MLNAINNKQMEEAINSLKEHTSLPMNTMPEKQSHNEAIENKMPLVDVPPTNPGRTLYLYICNCSYFLLEPFHFQLLDLDRIKWLRWKIVHLGFIGLIKFQFTFSQAQCRPCGMLWLVCYCLWLHKYSIF